MFTRLIYLHSR